MRRRPASVGREQAMHDSALLLDPTDERAPVRRPPAARPAQLVGPVGIIDISKPRGDVFCDEIERLIAERTPGVEVVRLRKPTFTRPAPPGLRDAAAARCRAVIQALAD